MEQATTDDPLLRLKYYQSTGQTDEAAKYEQYLKATNQLPSSGPSLRHDPALRARQAVRGKISDAEQADATDAQPGILGSLADAAQGLFPGMGALEAGARSVVRGQPYRDAYQDIKAQTDKVPTSAKLIGRTAASLPLLDLLPGSAAKSGAMLGAGDEVLSGDPDKGVGSRVAGGVTGGVLGALLGKAAETATTGLRAFRTPLSEANISAQKAARKASSDALYGNALAEGAQNGTNTPAINQVLAQPDNAAMVAGLSPLRQNAGLAPNSPELLDALYKARSDRAAALKKGLEAAIPARPNMGSASRMDNQMAQTDLLDAMSGGTTMPGPMPSYRAAVNDYAERSGNIGAVRRGQDALRTSIGKGVTTGKNLDRTTPTSFADWASSATPGQIDNVSQGVLGAAREATAKSPTRSLLGGLVGHGPLGKAPDLLRKAGGSRQSLIDLLTNAGLLGANAAISP